VPRGEKKCYMSQHVEADLDYRSSIFHPIIVKKRMNRIIVY
jgi:hypothetical protein